MRYIFNESTHKYWSAHQQKWVDFTYATCYADSHLANVAAQPILLADPTIQVKIVAEAVNVRGSLHNVDATGMPLTLGQIAALCSVANGNWEHQYAKDVQAVIDLGMVFKEADSYPRGLTGDVLALTAAGHRHVASLLSVRVGTTIKS